MKEIENLKELYLEEINKINRKGEVTPAVDEAVHKALEVIDKATDICNKTKMSEASMPDKGYSEGMMNHAYSYGPNQTRSMESRNYSYGMPEMNNGYSEGMMHSYGYSSGMMHPYNPVSYSYGMDDGYSGYRGQMRDNYGHYMSRDGVIDNVIRKLENTLHENISDKHREVINECVYKLKNY